MTKFSVATNFDPALLKEIGRLNKKYSPSKVTEIYGSLPISPTGSGRSPVGLPNISNRDLVNHIKSAHRYNIEFNYLMNSPIVGDINDAKIKKQIHQFVKHLKEIGVDSLTIANEQLIKYVKKEFPNFPIHVSLIAGINTAREAKKFSDLGVTSIVLNQHTVNRDLKKIKRIINATNCQIRLYASVSCLQNCPKRNGHYTWLGIQSKKTSVKENPQTDRFLLWCENEYIKKPIELLKSPFIRPEGLGFYKKIGVSSFKLSDRREPTSALVKLLEAYLSEEYRGNLFSLLFRDDRKWANAIRHIVDTESLGHTAIAIDNNKLTILDFDKKVTTLNGEELEKFYQLATGAAVRGISSPKTKSFHKKLHSFEK